ncbi:MAG: response regulator [Planctomycetes bacterium]|jgi:two-component system phosphate regulon response regulator PhoB|nr:response regulator [Planctomycetota bacterium]
MSARRPIAVVVEDEADILEVMRFNLEREGFRAVPVKDGDEALRRIRRDNPDIVLLDLMLPGIDGLEVCRRLRADEVTRDIPIVMVTAKGEESDVVLGLGLGADDYIVKPFSPRELVARVKAVLRRGPIREGKTGPERIAREGLLIDVARHELKVDGQPVTLTATEMRLLHFLAGHPGRVFTRDHLLSRVIGEHAVVVDRNIDVHVGSIRRKLGDYRDLIETVRGVGYRFKDVEA